MSKVYLKVKLSGSRNGDEWPDVGDSIDVPDDEAAQLVATGLASTEPVDITPEPLTTSPLAPSEAVEAANVEAAEAAEAAEVKAAKPVPVESAAVNTKPVRRK